jgi:hypothetical protein
MPSFEPLSPCQSEIFRLSSNPRNSALAAVARAGAACYLTAADGFGPRGDLFEEDRGRAGESWGCLVRPNKGSRLG